MKVHHFLFILALATGCAKDKDKGHHHAKHEQSGIESAQAKLSSAKGKVQGTVDFTRARKGVLVKVMVTGLKPNSVHGMHVHENGKCDPPDYKSAGGHFNPDNFPHGAPGGPKRHIGDFGNIVADAKGKAELELLLKKHRHKDPSIFVGKAVILHTKPDDLRTQPTGNAGDRLACGVIEAQ